MAPISNRRRVSPAPSQGDESGGLAFRYMADLRLRYLVDSETGCWVWNATKDRHGYGRYRGRMAHRVIWEIERGAVPYGLLLDHTCRNRLCVNPSHLRPVDHKTNALENSVGIAAANAAKSECPKCGGSFHTRPNGSRECKPCQRAADKAWRAANPERVKATKKRWRDKVSRGQRS